MCAANSGSSQARQALQRLGLRIAGLTAVTGGSICDAWRAETDAGPMFVKVNPGEPSPMFRTEAAGLTWLANAGAPVPVVVSADNDALVLRWLDSANPNPHLAWNLGATLARLHESCARAFGVAPPGATHGYIGSAPMPYGSWGSWGPF